MADTHGYHQNTVQDPCCMCGLTNSRSLHPPESRFRNGIFHFSQASLAEAIHIVEEGKSKIKALDQAIQNLQKHREQIHRAVLDHQQFLAPITRIPNDVLLQVFDHAVGWGWQPREGTLWALVAVSRRWRDLVFAYRAIWTRIALDFHRCQGEERQALLACWRTQFQLDRSNREPLECSLNLGSAQIYQHKFIRATIERLLSNLSKCTALQMRPAEFNWSGFASTSSNVPPQTLTRLQSLTIYHWKSNSSALLQSGFLSHLPSLRTLNFDQTRLPRATDIQPKSFTTVTHICLHHCAALPAEIVALLSATPNIQSLNIHPVQPAFSRNISGDPPPPPTHTAVLPFLRHLDIWSPSIDREGLVVPIGSPEQDHIAREVIRHIRAPTLSTLITYGADDEDILALQACMETTSPESGRTLPVKYLFLQRTTQNSILPLIDLIAIAPALSILMVAADIEPETALNIDPLLDALKWSEPQEDTAIAQGTGKRMCPDLWKLIFRECTMSRTMLKEMADSRSRGDDHLGSEDDGDCELVPEPLTDFRVENPIYTDEDACWDAPFQLDFR